MTQESEGARAPSEQMRQITIDALMEHFANDVMDVDEFERRVEIAHAATTSDELKALLGDLPGGGDLPVVREDAKSVDLAKSREYSMTSSSQVEERSFVVAALGGTSRRGRWSPARRNYAIAVCGGVELDLREAVFGPGVTEIRVFTMWGGVDVIVPPGINVESHGLAIMGGFDHAADTPSSGDPSQPTVRITGVALMAGVDVSVRYPGESARDARRRRRIEKREKKKRLRDGS